MFCVYHRTGGCARRTPVRPPSFAMSITMVMRITTTHPTQMACAWDPIFSDQVTERRKQYSRIEGEYDLPERVNIYADVFGRTLLAWHWLKVIQCFISINIM